MRPASCVCKQMSYYRPMLGGCGIWIVRIVLLNLPLLLFFSFSEQLFAQENGQTRAVSLLQRCLQTQVQTDRASMKVVAQREFPESIGNWPRFQRAESFVRRDGERLDVSQKYYYLKSPEFKGRDHRWRAIITKEMGILYSRGIDDETKPGKGIVDHNWEGWFTRHGINETTAGPLDGYFPHLYHVRTTELMLKEATTLQLHDNETVNGTLCKVVAAKTPYGIYTIWLAPSQGFLPVRATYRIERNDLYQYKVGEPRQLSEVTIPGANGQTHAASSYTGVLKDVVIEKIGDTFVTVAGNYEHTEWYTDVKVSATNLYKRTNIKLNPHFEGTDAFVPDLAEGARLKNDSDKTSGLIYVWRNGNVVAGGTEFLGTMPIAGHDARSSLQLWPSTLFGIALMVLGIRLAVRSKSALASSQIQPARG